MDAGKADRWHRLPADVREQLIKEEIGRMGIEVQMRSPSPTVNDWLRQLTREVAEIKAMLRSGDGKEQG